MKTIFTIIFKTAEYTNVIALLFLILGPYGIAITGALQVFSAALFLIAFPKNKLIYTYFGLVVIFFLLWDRKSFDLLFSIPLFLIFFLTYTLYNQKKELKTIH